MLSNAGPVGKLYLSIIDDVIESMRELFLDEGLEDRVLDDLKHLWESKMMQSKAMEDFRKSINSPNFVLQLPASYSQADQELSASVVIPANQNVHGFPVKNNPEALTTFSLPAGFAYPVQIPAGVTLQTASGQLYKVNVPVVVTQAPAGQRALSQTANKAMDWRGALARPSSAAAIHPQEVQLPFVPTASVTQPQQQQASVPSSQQGQTPPQPRAPSAEASPPPGPDSPQRGDAGGDSEPSPQSEPVNLSLAESPRSQLLDFRIRAEAALAQAGQPEAKDIDDILKEVIEVETEKAERARSLASAKAGDQAEAALGLDLDYGYSEISDIVQLDGAADSSDIEEEGAPLDENNFLGILNAEAIKALQEGDGSSDGNSVSSSSDGEGAGELANVEEEDPLNSGDDVIEQDIPDLFDTDNVIVCQYDKIHRSKNRWKFHLKDGVMCHGGRDYVFSKAVGEAEW